MSIPFQKVTQHIVLGSVEVPAPIQSHLRVLLAPVSGSARYAIAPVQLLVSLPATIVIAVSTPPLVNVILPPLKKLTVVEKPDQPTTTN